MQGIFFLKHKVLNPRLNMLQCHRYPLEMVEVISQQNNYFSVMFFFIATLKVWKSVSLLDFFIPLLYTLFFILCFFKEDGYYDFENERVNWPTCQVDVECPIPPPIPTDEEYVLKKVKYS